MLKKTDRLLRDFILYIFDLLKFLPLKLAQPNKTNNNSEVYQKEIIIIKTDEIGDYLLFRNLLYYLRSCKKFKSYRIILCGNIIWKNLAEYFDRDYVDEFVWLEKGKFSGNLLYRFNFLKMLSRRKPEILINCCYSRSYYIDDSIASIIRSKEKIAFKTDLSNSYKWQRKISNDYYSTLVDSEEYAFDLYKNRMFFEKLLNTKIDLIKPIIEVSGVSDLTSYGNSYMVFFMGGKRNYKKWKLNYYKEIAEYIITKYSLSIYFVGTESESGDNQLICNQLGKDEKVKDLSGKTSLTELTLLLRGAKLLISNDSGIVHLAASVNTKTIVVLNGTQFGRFLPYPKETGINISALYPPEIMQGFSDITKLCEKYKYRSLLDINTISPALVKTEIDKLLAR